MSSGRGVGCAGERVPVRPPLAIAWITLIAAGCALDDGDTPRERFGPYVTNECDQVVVAGVGDSIASAELDIREEPATLQPGWHSEVSNVFNRGELPDHLVLMVGVDADSAAMLELETSKVFNKVFDVVFDADCLTLTIE